MASTTNPRSAWIILLTLGVALPLAAQSDSSSLPAAAEAQAPDGGAVQARPEAAATTPDVQAPAPGTAPVTQPPDTTQHSKRRNPLPLAYTISGGASMGAYQAGYLQYVLSLLRLNPELAELKVLSGTSSGSIVAFLTMIEACRPDFINDPRKSNLYTLWTGVGLDQGLFDPNDVRPTAALSRESFRPHVAKLRALWDAGFPKKCDMLLGMTATRVDPDEVELDGGRIRLPHTEDKFMVRIQGQGLGSKPIATNYIDPNLPLPQPMLPLNGVGADPMGSLRDALFASSAFPLAFAPVRVKHCIHQPGQPQDLCTPANAQEALYVDGGLLDRQPLRMAVTLAASGLDTSGPHPRIYDVPDRRRREIPPGLIIGYLDAESSPYPPEAHKVAEDDAHDALSLVRSLFGGFILSARAKELHVLIEEKPGIEARLGVARALYPAISSHLFSFFGFVDPSFRRFDFYLGMHAAREDVELGLMKRLNLPADAIRKPEELKNGAVLAGYQPFRCMRAAYDGVGNPDVECANDSLRNMRQLIRMSLDRLYGECARAAEAADARGKAAPRTENHHCQRAMEGGVPPHINGVDEPADKGWRRGAEETDLDHTFRLLEHYQVELTGLGLPGSQAGRAKEVLRRRLGRIFNAFADQQGGERIFLEAIGAVALESLGYAPRTHTLMALFGSSIELGYILAIPAANWNWLRPYANFRLDGIDTLFSSADSFFAFSPQIGLEFEPVGLNSATWQFRFGGRFGYLLASSSGFRDCPPLSVRGNTPCSTYSVGAHISVSLLELARLQITGQVWPDAGLNGKTAWGIFPGIGVELWPF